MSRKRRREKRSTPPKKWIVQAAAIGGVLVLVAVILVLKGSKRADHTPAIAKSMAQATVTLPEAVGQTQATAKLEQVGSQAAATALPNELPEAQLERFLASGQPTLAFFHSNNCLQCIKMMEVVAQVYPEFDDSVALVDVNVYDQRNASLLERARIRAIPTQIFFNSAGKGQVVLGAMEPEEFRAYMRSLAGGQ